jgi:FKBP-type peptidyl-prolyl cis-trans isomerase SlyD
MIEVVAPELVVSFNYVLRDNDGEKLDSSPDGQPMLYLHGSQNIVPGLEKELLGKKVGDKLEVKVPAAEGYGERVADTETVPRADFPADMDLEPGISLMAEGPDGNAFPLWVVKVADDEVTVDPNHPLAGVELNFSVEITAIRAATKEELEHGHPHGPDGGHHH